MDKGEHNHIVTFTGRVFFPLAPRVEDVYIYDIAHSLAQQCRFTGHTRLPMSVAEHSVHVSEACPNYPMEGLLHDAAETYLCDMSAPVKHADHPLGRAYMEVEAAIEKAIAMRFDLVYPWPEEIHRADLIVRHTEARDLMHANYPKGGDVLARSLRYPWTAEEAERRFIARYRELQWDREVAE